MIKSPSTQTKGWLYGMFSQVLWGTGGIATKLVDRALPSSLLVGIRQGIGALILGLIIAKGRRNVFKNLPWLHVLMYSVIAAGLTDLMFVEAIRKCGVIIATMLARLEIPLGVIFAHFFLREKVGKSAYVAAVLSFIGVCLISYRPGTTFTLKDSFYLGVTLAVITAILWGLSTVYAKHILNRKQFVDPLALSFIRLSVGAVIAFVIVAAVVKDPLQALTRLQLNDWLLLLYLGIFVSGLAYLAYFKSLKIISAHVSSILLSVSIAVLLILGLAIGESISTLQWFGIAVVALSIYLVKKPASAD